MNDERSMLYAVIAVIMVTLLALGFLVAQKANIKSQEFSNSGMARAVVGCMVKSDCAQGYCCSYTHECYKCVLE